METVVRNPNLKYELVFRQECNTLSWKNICVYVPVPKMSLFKRLRNRKVTPDTPNYKQILFNVSGEVKAGTLLAIMGASGAGKTTLLSVLAETISKNMQVTGQVLIDNETSSNINNFSSFIQQDDLFIGTLTTKEHLLIQAELRMGTTTTEKERIDRVENIMKSLGLIKCQNTLIGVPGRVQGISGGELRRLAIATELINHPQILFADEPTSGLDSFMAMNVVKSLRQIADDGSIVICTIHQPSSDTFELFDQLYLMAEGKVVYTGSSAMALDTFIRLGYPCPVNYNPADHYIRTLAINPGNEDTCLKTVMNFHENYLKDNRIVEDNKENNKPYKKLRNSQSFFKSSSKAPTSRQLSALTKRSWLSQIQNRFITTIRIIQTLAFAIVIDLIYRRKSDGSPLQVMDYNGALFYVITNISFSSLYGAIFVFPMEFIIYRREHKKDLYRSSMYFLSKIITEIPMETFIPLIYSVIIYFMIDLTQSPSSFFLFYAIVLLSSTCARSWGYIIAACSNSFPTANALAGPIILPFMLFGGFFIQDKNIPDYFIWLRYLSWIKYGFEAMCINQYQYIPTGLTYATTVNLTGLQVLDAMNINPNNLSLDLGVLSIIAIGVRILALLLLLIRANFFDD